MSDSEVNDDYYPIGQDVADMKRALRAGEEYLDHDAEWWAEQLQSVFAPELIEDVTGVSQAPQQPRASEDPADGRDEDFDQAMMRLAAFNVDGSHYNPEWEVNFPIFDGEAPEGHPHPLAFAVNYARQDEEEDAPAPPVRRRTTARRMPMSGASSAQKRQRRRAAPTPKADAFGQLRV
jgi:hypothetical protein